MALSFNPPDALGRGYFRATCGAASLAVRKLNDCVFRPQVRTNSGPVDAVSTRERSANQRGEVRRRYREGQGDRLGALGLVVNAVVLWNTLSMDAALAHLRRQDAETKPEDVARLSP
jgi:hypothetical protein